MNTTRLAAAALAALGAASGVPFALAQLDYAGIVNLFGVDPGDTAHGVVVLAGIGGVLTLCVVVSALAGAALCLTGSTAARPLLIAAAIAGFLTAFIFWLPPGIAIGAAAVLAGPGERGRGRALPAP